MRVGLCECDNSVFSRSITLKGLIPVSQQTCYFSDTKNYIHVCL